MIKLDASSLIFMLKMDFIDVLTKLDTDIIITRKVHEEVVTRGKVKGKADAYICEKLVKEGIVKVHEPPAHLLDASLGLGERETIQNALENQCSCILDDQKAQRMAISIKVPVKQVPFLILEALKKKFIALNEFKLFFDKWVHHADPPTELMELVKNMKELLI
jgi:predicted nucleic acid-binding protein